MLGKQKTKLNIASPHTRGTFARKWAVVAFVCAYVITSVVGGFVYQAAPAQGAIPKLINFQGKLTQVSNGGNVANGTYAFEFKLYDALTAGTLLWTETYDQAPVNACQKIQVTNGVFNTKLGSCNPLTSVDLTTGSLYLTVNFAPTGVSYDGEMSPRKQLVSSAYAFVANSVSGDGVVNNAIQSATALSTGRTSANPALQVDTNTASSVTGLKVTSAAAAGGLALAVISSGTNENLTLDAKGSGTMSLGATSTGDILFGGGSASTGCTVTNSNGNFACAGAITGSNLSGANTGDVTLAGTPDYITISGQVITRNKLDPADDLNTFASSVLSGLLTDETGTGVAVFGTSPTLTTPNIVTSINDTNGNELFNLTATASAVNEFTVANAATTTAPTLSASGGDTNIGMTLRPKGTGTLLVKPTGAAVTQFEVQDSTGAVWFQVIGGTNSAFFRNNIGDLLTTGGNWAVTSGGRFIVTSSGAFEWRVSSGGSVDTQLSRNAAGVVQVGTSAANSLGSLIATNITANTNFLPDANDGAGLGTTALQFSDLFLAEGGVINWDNGDATLTQVGDVVTLAGADLKVTTAGNASTSVITTDATQTLSNKTLTAPVIVNGGYIADGNGNEQIIFNTTASAVNELTVTNAATGGIVTMAATGGDTNVELRINSKGTDSLSLNGLATGDILLGGGSASTGCTVTNSTGALACTSGGTFNPAGSAKLSVTNTTATTTTGVLAVDTTTGTDFASGIYNSYLLSTTGSITATYGMFNSMASGSIVSGAGVGQTMYGSYTSVSKSAADTATGTMNTIGSYSEAYNTGRTNVGTVNVYGGQFLAVGDTNGTSTAIGLQSSASGADNNYAAIFSAGNVGIGDTSPNSLFTVGNNDLFQINTTGQIGSQQAPVSDYLFALAGTTGNDHSRIIDITQANDVNENSTVLNIANTVNLGSVSTSRSIKNISGTLTPTLTALSAGEFPSGVKIYGNDQSINTSNITLGDAPGDYNDITVIANKGAITGTPIINNTDTSSGASHKFYGTNSTISITPTFTAVDVTNGFYYGGYFSSIVSSAGNGDYNPTVYGLYAEASSDLTTTGATSQYGGYFSAGGTADTNYGLWVDSSGATNNYAAIFNTGNVGIGDTTPVNVLTVTGAASISSVLQVGQETVTTYSRLGAGTTGHSLGAADDLLISDDLEVDGDTFLDGTLTVGGTTAITGNLLPSTDNTYDLGSTSLRWKTLHVGPGSVVVHNDATNTLKATLGFSGSTAQLLTDAATPLQITTGANVGLNIDTSGRVGIGTAGPAAQLEVSSASSPAARIIRTVSGSGSNITEAFSIRAQSSADMVDFFGPIMTFAIQDDAGISNSIAEFGAQRNGADTNGDMIFRTRNGASTSEKLRISTLGNIILNGGMTSVGTNAQKVISIGAGTAPTTSPADLTQLWTADWNGAGTNALFMRTEEGTQHVFGSNVGIGTTGPTALLDVRGVNNSSNISLFVTGSNTNGTVAKFNRGGIGGSEKSFYIGATGNTSVNLASEGDFKLKVGVTADLPNTTGVDALTILSGGNVGIGTTAPDYALELSGATAPKFALSDTGLAHGVTDFAQTDAYLLFEQATNDDGGARIWGFSDAVGQIPQNVIGVFGSTDPTDTTPAVLVQALKRTGTTLTNLGSLETAFKVSGAVSTGTDWFTILGSGNVGIGTTAPINKVDIIDSAKPALLTLGSANTATWSRVGGDAVNSSWADATYEYVHALYNHNGKLYAGLGGSVTDAEVWEYNGSTWTKVGGDGTNSSWNVGTESFVTSFTSYNGKLYASLNGAAGDGEVWEYNGSTWTKVGGDAVNSSWAAATYEDARALASFNGKLYAGTGTGAGEGEVWEYNGSTWTQIGGTASGNWGTTDHEYIPHMAAFNGKLYAGLGFSNGDAEVWEYSGSGTTWTQIGGTASGNWGTATHNRATYLTPYNGKLYVGLGEDAGEAEVWQYSGSSTTWTKVGGDAVNSSWADSTYEFLLSMASYNGKLYTGLSSGTGDAEVWEFAGNTWTNFARNDSGISVGDYLFLGANNRVGINNSQPESTLDVQGDFRVSGNLLYAKDGRVGIGTASPVDQLSVLPASSGGIRVHRVGSGSGNGQYWGYSAHNSALTDVMIFGQSSSTYTTGGTLGWVGNSETFLYYPSGNFKIGVGTGSTPAMTLNSSGNVGIGTATPNPLGVSSATYGRVLTVASPTADARAVTELWNSTDSMTSGTIFGQINFLAGSTAKQGAVIAAAANGTAEDAADLLFYTSASSGSVVERMRIDKNGTVGIGTSTLDAVGSSYVSQYFGRNNSIMGYKTADASSSLQVVQNAYFDGANWKYIASLVASQYYQYQGTHNFLVAGSGTAGNNITWTSALSIANTGLVSVTLGGTASTNAVCSSLANATGPTAGVTYELRDCNAAPAADYAEDYPVESGIEYGDIVTTGTELIDTHGETNGNIDWNKVIGQVTKLVKSNKSYQSNIVGIVSDNHGDFTSAGHNIKQQDNPMPVALNGRVPVKVTNENGPIEPGDYLTSSATLPGYAMKAVVAGPIIGMALESFSGGTGKVLVFVKTTNFNGLPIEQQIEGVAFDYTDQERADYDANKILEHLLAQLPTLDSDNLSEVVTDVVVANAEVITPRITTGALRTDSLSSATAEGGLEVASTTIFNGGLQVDSIKSIGDLLAFDSDVEFFGTPYFTTDTAGFAVVKAGVQTVDVVFTREYLAQPIVNATFSFEQDADLSDITDPEVLDGMKAAQVAQAQAFLAEGVSYVVTNKSTNGFTIVMSKPASADVKFSWTAFAVRNATTFMSLDAPETPLADSGDPDPDGDSGSGDGIVLGDGSGSENGDGGTTPPGDTPPPSDPPPSDPPPSDVPPSDPPSDPPTTP